MSVSLIDLYTMPGMGTPVESSEREFMAGPISSWQVKGVVLDSTTVDSGNTPTTLLRRGLLLGKITATGQYADYDPTETNGQEIARGILFDNVNMLDNTATAVDKQGRMVVYGFDVKASQLINLDDMARRQLAHRIFFDDGWDNESIYLPLVVVKTADYTVTSADNNKTFTTRGAAGAVNFTLPTLARGLRFTFFNEADQNMTVTSAAADTIIAANDLAVDSVAFTTAGDKIGGCVEVFANDNASKWVLLKKCSNAMTITT